MCKFALMVKRPKETNEKTIDENNIFNSTLQQYLIIKIDISINARPKCKVFYLINALFLPLINTINPDIMHTAKVLKYYSIR